MNRADDMPAPKPRSTRLLAAMASQESVADHLTRGSPGAISWSFAGCWPVRWPSSAAPSTTNWRRWPATRRPLVHRPRRRSDRGCRPYAGRYLLVIDSAVPTQNGGVTCCIAGQSAVELLKGAAASTPKARGGHTRAPRGRPQADLPVPS